MLYWIALPMLHCGEKEEEDTPPYLDGTASNDTCGEPFH